MESKNEDLTSKGLIIKDLMDQIEYLKKKLHVEQEARLKVEQTIQDLRSKVRNMSLVQDKKTQIVEREKDYLKRKAEELEREKDNLDVTLKRINDYQKLSRTLTKSNVNLRIALKEAWEKVAAKRLSAQEVLDKFSIDDGVLSGIESDLNAILHT